MTSNFSKKIMGLVTLVFLVNIALIAERAVAEAIGSLDISQLSLNILGAALCGTILVMLLNKTIKNNKP